MIIRDENQIILQHDIFNRSYADGGDSAARCGIMALCGSYIDQKIIAKFYIGNGYCVRHPLQFPHNSSNTFSRDQAIQYMAGLWRSKYNETANAILKRIISDYCFMSNTHFHPSLVKKEFPQGPDFCHPGVMWHFILCAKAYRYYWLAPIGYLFQICDLIWACFVKPFDEQNQAFCMFAVSGLLPLYLKMHPDFRLAMSDYWLRWRDQKQIYESIVNLAKCHSSSV